MNLWIRLCRSASGAVLPAQLFEIMWYVYILLSLKDNQTYVGITNDLKKRFSLHNNGKVFATKGRIPFILIYYEAHHNKFDALTREKFLKTGWGKNWIKRTLKNYLAFKKLGGQVS